MKENMEKTSLPVPWPLRGQKCQLRIVQRKEGGRKYEFSLGRQSGQLFRFPKPVPRCLVLKISIR